MTEYTLNEYQEDAQRSLKQGESLAYDLNHMALGIAGEAGELVDCIKKHTIYNKPLDEENAIEEVGDILWYAANLCNILGITLETAAKRNIGKLALRYPEKYTDELASARLDK
jgi:NTP pyrophosphatase (non-canonical NTP hydrolase)